MTKGARGSRHTQSNLCNNKPAGTKQARANRQGLMNIKDIEGKGERGETEAVIRLWSEAEVHVEGEEGYE